MCQQLQNKVFTQSLLGLTAVRSELPDTTGGKECFLITGTERHKDDTCIWICAAGFSIKKMREDVVISAEDIEKWTAELLEKNPELYKEARMSERAFREQKYTKETEYSVVHFDSELDETVFVGSNFPPQ